MSTKTTKKYVFTLKPECVYITNWIISYLIYLTWYGSPLPTFLHAVDRKLLNLSLFASAAYDMLNPWPETTPYSFILYLLPTPLNSTYSLLLYTLPTPYSFILYLLPTPWYSTYSLLLSTRIYSLLYDILPQCDHHLMLKPYEIHCYKKQMRNSYE